MYYKYVGEAQAGIFPLLLRQELYDVEEEGLIISSLQVLRSFGDSRSRTGES